MSANVFDFISASYWLFLKGDLSNLFIEVLAHHNSLPRVSRMSISEHLPQLSD